MATAWNPPIELSPSEEKIVKLTKQRKLYAFFRRYRHRLFDEEMQQLLLAGYDEVARGHSAIPPAQLALAMLMQAAFGVPDHEVPTLTVVDRRWQMVLDCQGIQEPAFCQATLFNFRMRALEEGWDRLLIEKTVQLARETGGGAATLRAALDSSPLWGAGQVEDTFNLIGHAAARVVEASARRLGQTVEEVAARAGIPLVAATSLKAALDLDWQAPEARQEGLNLLLGQVRSLQRWLERELTETLKTPTPAQPLATLHRLIAQDTEEPPDGGPPRIKQAVAKDRQISLGDPDMRHGRKSSSKRFNGYKRHVAVDLNLHGLICAVVLTPANEPEGRAATPLFERLEAQGLHVECLQVDLAYVDAEAVVERRRSGMKVVARPYAQPNGGLFSKADFALDFDAMTATCPAAVSVPMKLGKTLSFPVDRCALCPRRSRCTSAEKGGRSLRIREDEPFQAHLRTRQKTPEGRAELRGRTEVEHTLARIGQSQGTRARYRGQRKNEFDLARHAVVNNCYILGRIWDEAA